MNRAELERYIAEGYSTQGENPWAQSPTNTVFRHRHNRKWFAILMDIPREKLGLTYLWNCHVVPPLCFYKSIIVRAPLRRQTQWLPPTHRKPTRVFEISCESLLPEPYYRVLPSR